MIYHFFSFKQNDIVYKMESTTNKKEKNTW
jgi:hypothetical protein